MIAIVIVIIIISGGGVLQCGDKHGMLLMWRWG
jgi:hypothetical protein